MAIKPKFVAQLKVRSFIKYILHIRKEGGGGEV